MAKDLTIKALENLKPGPARREVPDGHTRGLFYVLQPTGAASWAATGAKARLCMRYRHADRLRLFTSTSTSAVLPPAVLSPE